jgi:hypothetical protein
MKDQDNVHVAGGKLDSTAPDTKHSATPWVEDENCTDDVDNMVACLLAGKGTAREWVAIGIEDADGYAESVAYCHPDNAPLIVRAWNAYDVLVEALGESLVQLREYAKAEVARKGREYNEEDNGSIQIVLAALAKVTA